MISKRIFNELSFLLIIALVIFFFSCDLSYSKYSKKDHIGTIKIRDRLYNEIFCVYKGGMGANSSFSNYLTDSTNFRKYIGTIYCDDEEIYCKEIDSSRIMSYRMNIRNDYDTLEKNIYIISDLKKEGKFE